MTDAFEITADCDTGVLKVEIDGKTSYLTAREAANLGSTLSLLSHIAVSGTGEEE